MAELKSLLSPNQGTTVRVITAVDQDKGRPRGIGYTIVSGKPKSALFVPSPKRATAGASGSKSCGLHGVTFEPCLQLQPLLRKGTNVKGRNGLKGPDVWGPWEEECV